MKGSLVRRESRILNSVEQGSSSEDSSHWATQISRPFMEPENSSPCLQKPATGSYPEPDEPNIHPHTLFVVASDRGSQCWHAVSLYGMGSEISVGPPKQR
jgi:hypothetical protein